MENDGPLFPTHEEIMIANLERFQKSVDKSKKYKGIGRIIGFLILNNAVIRAKISGLIVLDENTATIPSFTD